ncbi:hypothetical protein B9Z55_007967 [Caenorhabditis nigoni]|uniref:SCP domain-containing protein n=1 Tax=Caenorhabditis nigoni TaxID=1611254 RepID=A0A2G5VCN0_9PELO|nr:hypothetical protein B9Z55_007967 [Caenorhabditis nigoni]
MNLFSFALWIFFIPFSFSDPPNAQFMKELNDYRRDFAKKHGVPRCYELIYNSSLESLARSSERFFHITSLDNADFLKASKSIPPSRLNSKTLEKSQGYLEALVPLQKQIGCLAAKSGYYCVLAPETNYQLFEVSKTKLKAGSECENEYRNSDGLCVYIGWNTNFADRLNNIRRRIGKSHKIMEMLEVKFDSKIASLANPSELTWNFINEAENQGFGYFKLPTYDIDEKEFAAEIKNFLKLDDNARKTEIEKSDGTKYGGFIFPSATIFGCQWDESQKCFQCFIGPRHSPYPILKSPLKILGTDCPDGFENDKGLCIQDKTNPKSVLQIVNEARRTAAKYLGIGNMPELTWSEDLHQTVKNWDGKSSQEIQNVTDSEKYVKWRYDSSERATLQGRLAVFLINWRQKGPMWFTKPPKPTPYMGRTATPKPLSEDQQEMEYLNPVQTKIGCAHFKKSGAKKEQFACLFGPSGNFERFDYYKSIPGSYCPANFKTKDGLCADIGDPEEFLKNVNSFRKDHANSYNITDMHELIWNAELEEIAKDTTWSYSDAPIAKPYRYVLLHNYQLSEQRLKSEMAALKNLETGKREILYKRIHGSSFGISELAEPLQKFIGCSYRDQDIANGLLCIIGPREMAQPWRLENRGVRIPGTKKYRPFIPGSNCTAGYSNSDGLCTPINSSTLTLFGNQEDFIKDVNEYRRRLAKEYNTRAMFELYHSKDLETMLSVLDWDVSWPLARVSYRYLRFRSFNSVFDKIPGQFSDLKKLSQKERRVNVYESLSAGYLELLEPAQHLIACALKKSKRYKFEGSEEFVVCALGPMGEMEMWGLTEIFHTNLAAACGDSSHFYQRSGLPQKFVPNDGLCSKTPDTKLSYFGNRRFFMEQANLVRKDRARRYALPKFMKLIWDSDLVEEAKHLPFDSTNPPQLIGKPFRWFKIPHYHFHADDIKGEFFDRITYADKAKMAEWIEKMKPTSIGILELFGEGQEKIGCARRNTSAEMFYLCLLGPEPRFKLIALEKEYKKGLPKKEGRDCPRGTWSDGGLCTPDSEKPVPKKRKRRTTTTTSTRYSTTTAKSKKSSNRPLNIFWNLLAVSIFCCFI